MKKWFIVFQGFLLSLLPFFLSFSSPARAGEMAPVRIAVIPVIDTLPLFVAQAEGLFAKAGLEVKLIPVTSAPERDQMLQADQADGTLNELMSVMLFNRTAIRMQAVRYGLMATKENPHFFLLASGSGGIHQVKDLKGAEIGISKGTIIEYVADRLLAAHGLDPAGVKYVSVPKISDRMSLLAGGQLKAAVMPDPLAALAVQQGAKIILHDAAYPKPGASVLSFMKGFVDRNPRSLKAFLGAVEEAVNRINRSPSSYRNLLAEKKIVPPALISSYTVPKFPLAALPGEAEWRDVLNWAKAKGFLNVDLIYKDSVNASFLP
jgi:NitT/TauT family transport system substrate-binding protein